MNKMNLFDESKIIVTLPEEPIQDEEGNLTFTLKDNTFSLIQKKREKELKQKSMLTL